jgi:Fe-S-cluster formation regulator IscX/YfhJ
MHSFVCSLDIFDDLHTRGITRCITAIEDHKWMLGRGEG